MVNMNIFPPTNSKLNSSAFNCPNQSVLLNTILPLKFLLYNNDIIKNSFNISNCSTFMSYSNMPPGFYIKNKNAIQTVQMPFTKFPFFQPAFLNENPHSHENDKENDVFSNTIFSDLFQSKFGNLAPARVIYENFDFNNTYFKSNGIMQKNELFYDDNESNASTEDFEWDQNEKSIININCNASFIEKFSEDVKPVSTQPRNFINEISSERIVTGQGLIHTKEEIPTEELVNLKSQIVLQPEITLPPYNLFPLDTIRKTPSLALQFNFSELHKNFFEDPRVNKRFINYEQS